MSNLSDNEYLFTSESVTEGHPDKVADQISDAVLDAVCADDPNGRVACETLSTTGLVVVAGEITTTTYVDMPGDRARGDPRHRLHRRRHGLRLPTPAASSSRSTSSPPTSPRASTARTRAAPIRPTRTIAGRRRPGHDVRLRLRRDARADAAADHARAPARRAARRGPQGRQARLPAPGRQDARSRSSTRTAVPVASTTVVVSHPARARGRSQDADQRDDDASTSSKPVAARAELYDAEQLANYLVNPTGRFVIGGPHGDAGLTGRKIIVDTYGGMARHGGGAFSGKDPTKVDRSAAYAARYVAKNVVAAGLADRCEVQVAYAIGVAQPVSIMVDTFGTGKIDGRQDRQRWSRACSTCAPRAIIERARSAPPDLQAHRRLRPLRPHRRRVHVGEDRQGRHAARAAAGLGEVAGVA